MDNLTLSNDKQIPIPGYALLHKQSPAQAIILRACIELALAYQFPLTVRAILARVREIQAASLAPIWSEQSLYSIHVNLRALAEDGYVKIPGWWPICLEVRIKDDDNQNR